MSKATLEAQRQSAILAHNLKDQVRNLAMEYNAATDTKNNQSKLLNKYNQYISLQNRNIEKQLRELKDIESHVATRDSLVRGNQTASQEKEKKIHVLKVFFIVILYLVLVIIAFLGKKISLAFLLTNILAVLLVYVAYVAWVYNVLEVRHFTRFAEREGERMKRDIYEAGREIEDEINQYVNGNCECPLEPINGTNGQRRRRAKKLDKRHKPGTLPYMDGIYYYDGTAPQERIYPNIPEVGTSEFKKENPDKFNIQWETAPDMGSRDNKRYTPQPTFMPETAGLPRTSKGDCVECSKHNGSDKKVKEQDFWTVDL